MTPTPDPPMPDNLSATRLVQLWSGFRDRMVDSHRRTRRALSEHASVEPLLSFAAKYLPEHFSQPPSAMHAWLSSVLSSMSRRRGSKLNVLAPRGAAKSTVATLAYPLWATLNDLEPYVWIVSDTHDQAVAHLENLKAELTDNRLLARDYPERTGRGPVWRSDRIALPGGATIEAYGTAQRIRGRRHRHVRPTLIVCDDLENDDHILSSRRRERSRSWFFGTLLAAGTPSTNILNLATALHREALAVRLHRTPGWKSRRFRAVLRWPTNMELWHEWESIYIDPDRSNASEAARRFYQTHREEMDAGAEVLWPEVEDLYTLMAMRAETGPAAFAREKQNSPVPPELCEWPESYFDDRIWFEQWPEHLAVKTLALDPSKGTDSRRGDYSAFVMAGVDRDGVIYLEGDLARRPTPQIVADGVELHLRFQPDAFGVETNQFQELLAGEFASEFRRRGLLGVYPWSLNNRVNKQVRIRRLGPHLAAGRIRFREGSPGTRLLVDQLREFPLCDHDDGPDAAEMALRMAAELLADPSDNDGLGNRLPV